MIPHGPKVLADQGSESLVWVCEYCDNVQYGRNPDITVAPPCARIGVGDEDAGEPCEGKMVPGVEVTRCTVYEP